jgi:hypothetical protein
MTTHKLKQGRQGERLWHESGTERGKPKRMKGLEPSTFCMASRRSSQLSYIREGAQYSRAQPPSFSRRSGTTSSGSG